MTKSESDPTAPFVPSLAQDSCALESAIHVARSAVFGNELFSSPALFAISTIASRPEYDVEANVQNIASKIGISNETMLRWISVLEIENMIERVTLDASDAFRLSPKAKYIIKSIFDPVDNS